jgi:hypothetical protein
MAALAPEEYTTRAWPKSYAAAAARGASVARAARAVLPLPHTRWGGPPKMKAPSVATRGGFQTRGQNAEHKAPVRHRNAAVLMSFLSRNQRPRPYARTTQLPDLLERARNSWAIPRV